MADLKISQLSSATTPLAGTEVLPVVQSGSTKKVSVANLTAGRAVAFAGGTFSDNLIQGTAAKGVNFTANTPLAGMTSQLLNWYEEGTYTATITAGSGSFTSVAQSLKYTRIGRIVHVDGYITINTNGTAASYWEFTLPYNAPDAKSVSFGGRENYVSGLVFGGTTSSTSTVAITKYDGTYIGGNGYNFPISFSYAV